MDGTAKQQRVKSIFQKIQEQLLSKGSHNTPSSILIFSSLDPNENSGVLRSDLVIPDNLHIFYYEVRIDNEGREGG